MTIVLCLLIMVVLFCAAAGYLMLAAASDKGTIGDIMLAIAAAFFGLAPYVVDLVRMLKEMR